MPRPETPPRRTGRPPSTSREQILDAARRLIDTEGMQKLTIRRLAAELGVGPTTLYHHVRDKDDLLIQLLDHHGAQIERPPLPEDPRERIVVAATVMHDSLASWPEAAEVLSADDVIGESALWMVDAIVGGAVDAGCTPEQAVYLYRSVWYYTLGEILVRARSTRRAADDRPRHRDTVVRTLDDGTLPHLAPLGERWPQLAARDTYRDGLRALVEGVLTQVGATR